MVILHNIQQKPFYVVHLKNWTTQRQILLILFLVHWLFSFSNNLANQYNFVYEKCDA